MAIIGSALFIRAKAIRSNSDETKIDLNITNMDYLENLSGHAIESLTLMLDTNFKEKDFFTAIQKLEPHPESDGTLYLLFTDIKSAQSIKIKLGKKVPLTRELINILDDWKIKYRCNQK